MHIGIFTNNYLPNPYGVSTSVDGFRKGLHKAGHQVSLFAPAWDDARTHDVEEGIYRYPSIDLPMKVPFSLVVPYAPKIDADIEQLDFDVVHAQHPNLLGAQAQRWARTKDVPLIFTWHSLYDRYAHYASFVPETLAAKWVMKNAIAYATSADHVIVPTESVRKIIEKEGLQHRNIHVIPSGVDEDLFAHADGMLIRNKYHIPEKASLIVSVSRITEEKNVRFLARAVKKALAQNEDAYFIFGGEGDLMNDVRAILESEIIRDRVVFAGKVLRDEVKHYLAAADVFVYASTSETQGTIITEAMYMGVPVVAVRASGIEDLIIDGKTGILTREAASDLAYAVLGCLKDINARQDCMKYAKQYAKENYTVEVCTQKLIAVYEQAIAEHESKHN